MRWTGNRFLSRSSQHDGKLFLAPPITNLARPFALRARLRNGNNFHPHNNLDCFFSSPIVF